MKRKSPFGFLGFSLATIALCALALYLFAVNAPDSVPGENLLEWQYNRATDKNAVLQEYRARIWAHGGGTVPDGAARFFAARLDGDTSHVQNEVAAIARFYASQSGMREGNFGQLLSEKARQRLVDAILRDWRTYPEKNAWRAFVFIEALRQNTYIGKAFIDGGDFPDTYAKLAPVAAKFQAWNQRYRATPITARPAALAGTIYAIESI